MSCQSNRTGFRSIEMIGFIVIWMIQVRFLTGISENLTQIPMGYSLSPRVGTLYLNELDGEIKTFGVHDECFVDHGIILSSFH